MNKTSKLGLMAGGFILLALGSAFGVRQWAYSTGTELANSHTKDGNKAVQRLKIAYYLGKSDAAAYLGDVFINNNIIPSNTSQAFHWYKLAAESGDASSQYNIGRFYANGEGVTQDYSEAVKWYGKSVEQGNSSAQCSLGALYFQGLGVKQDTHKAFQLFQSSSDQGNPYAQVNLAVCYQTGNGTQTDYQKAFTLFSLASKAGNPAGTCGLGSMYANGQGVEKDIGEAVKLFRVAASQGNADAKQNLMRAYSSGEAIPTDGEANKLMDDLVYLWEQDQSNTPRANGQTIRHQVSHGADSDGIYVLDSYPNALNPNIMCVDKIYLNRILQISLIDRNILNWCGIAIDTQPEGIILNGRRDDRNVIFSKLPDAEIQHMNIKNYLEILSRWSRTKG